MVVDCTSEQLLIFTCSATLRLRVVYTHGVSDSSTHSTYSTYNQTLTRVLGCVPLGRKAQRGCKQAAVR